MAQANRIPFHKYMSAQPADMAHPVQTALRLAVKEPRNKRHQDDQEKAPENNRCHHLPKTQLHGFLFTNSTLRPSHRSPSPDLKRSPSSHSVASFNPASPPPLRETQSLTEPSGRSLSMNLQDAERRSPPSAGVSKSGTSSGIQPIARPSKGVSMAFLLVRAGCSEVPASVGWIFTRSGKYLTPFRARAPAGEPSVL